MPEGVRRRPSAAAADPAASARCESSMASETFPHPLPPAPVLVTGAPPPRSVPLPLAHPGAALLETLWGTLRLRGRPPLTREAVNLVGSHHRIGTERTRRELGYEPRVRYPEALRAIQTYLQQGVLQ